MHVGCQAEGFEGGGAFVFDAWRRRGTSGAGETGGGPNRRRRPAAPLFPSEERKKGGWLVL